VSGLTGMSRASPSGILATARATLERESDSNLSYAAVGSGTDTRTGQPARTCAQEKPATGQDDSIPAQGSVPAALTCPATRLATVAITAMMRFRFIPPEVCNGLTSRRTTRLARESVEASAMYLSRCSQARKHPTSSMQSAPFVDSQESSQHSSLRMSSSFRRRLSAMLMLPALLFAGWAHGSELFRCRYDEVVRRTCCCPQSRAPETTGCSVRGPSSGCCDVRTIGVDASPTSSARLASLDVPSVVWRLPGQELAVLDLRPPGAAARRDVPDTSPPVLRLTCSLQI
jgi:hypothetical protein